MILTARYIIPIEGQPLENGALVVRDELILDIGPSEEMLEKYPHDEVKDFGRAAIMPGLVDLHTHLEYSALRGIVHDVPYAEWLALEHKKADLMTYDDRLNSARIGCMEMIQGGVTTVAEFSSSGASLEAIKEMGLRASVYRSVGALEKSAVGTAVDSAVSDIRTWRENSDDSLIHIGIAPKALHACHPELFSQVNAIAEKDNLPVAMHIAGSSEEYRFIRYGTTPLSVRGIEGTDENLTDRPMHLPAGVTPVNYALNWEAFDSRNVLAVHCVHVDAEDIRQLQDNDVAIAISTRANAQLGMGLAPLPEYIRAGLRVGLGTDSPAAIDTADMFVEMRLGMLLHRAVNSSEFLTAETMLYLATLGGARALRMDDKIGSLKKGKRADIIVVDLSSSRQTPLVDPVMAVVTSASATDVRFTMVNGKVLYNDETFLTGIDGEEVTQRVIETRYRLRDE
ncbi:MAG: amidohydrolase family protein [Eggerthellaceae bacterium]|nr:amidohydrolase family protein [Eggerthellaceae bacterium]